MCTASTTSTVPTSMATPRSGHPTSGPSPATPTRGASLASPSGTTLRTCKTNTALSNSNFLRQFPYICVILSDAYLLSEKDLIVLITPRVSGNSYTQIHAISSVDGNPHESHLNSTQNMCVSQARSPRRWPRLRRLPHLLHLRLVEHS